MPQFARQPISATACSCISPIQPAPRRAAAGLDGVEEIEIVVKEGVRLIAWHAPAKSGKPTILYFHGNAANASNRVAKIELIREHGFGVLYLNNRGYGGSGGRPTEEDNVADAIAAYDHLTGFGVPAGEIVAYGESLGSGQAVRPVAAVVLEAPLTSTVDVGRKTYFWLPLGLLITDQYYNERNIRSVTAPVLILHGEQDNVIPVNWVCGSTAPPMSRSSSNCFPRPATMICSSTVPGRRPAPSSTPWAVEL
jgi:pimeloyl-ACP methyl ester carboxylesterase